MRLFAAFGLHVHVTLALTFILSSWLAGTPLPAAAASASSIAVTTTSDLVDGTTTSFTTLLRQPGADQTISLREALLAANAMTAGTPITITFDLPLPTPTAPTTITLAISMGALPSLDRGDLRIDATTQPQAAPILLDGGNRNWVSDGLVLNSPRNQVRGLAISNFYNNGIVLHGKASDNVITDVQLLGNYLNGVLLDGPNVTRNTVQRSMIAQNSAAGIQVSNAAHTNTVGGSTAAGNTVRANGLFGIVVSDVGTNENSIRGNTLTSHLPTAAGAVAYAIWLSNDSHATVIEQNRIAGNQYGIRIDDSSANQIRGNQIGLAQNGLTAEPNIVNGILIGSDATNNLIGGEDAVDRNLISGNIRAGIMIFGTQNTVRNTDIGLGVDGVTAVGNGGDGMMIRGANNIVGPDNRIANQRASGIAVAGANTQIVRNVIESNGRGICIIADAAQVITNTIRFNGEGSTSDACDTRGGGVLARGNASLVANNIIHNNTGAGVAVLAGSGNRVQANSITNNSAAGITLQTGANDQIAQPVILQVSATMIRGSGCTGCQIELFADDSDEGRTLLGKTLVGADGRFTLTIMRSQLSAPHVTATATDQAGSTSIFAMPFDVPFDVSPRTRQTFLPVMLAPVAGR